MIEQRQCHVSWVAGLMTSHPRIPGISSRDRVGVRSIWSGAMRASTEVLVEPGEGLLPGVHGLLRPERATVVVPEGVSGPVVAVELVHLAVLLQPLLVLVDL